MSDTPPPVRIETARNTGFSGVSVVWLIPLIALIAALGVAWKSYNDRGPVIEISFENGAGVAERETELRYRDITVGVVEEIGFTPALEAVVVSVRVDKKVAPFIDASSKFWIVRPELTTQGVSGLDTVLSGVYIEGAWDSEIGPEAYQFKGLSDPPLFETGKEGLQIAFRTTPGGDLIDNSPITFRGIEVGRVGKAQISREGNYAIAEAIIYEDHSGLVNRSTRFWNTAGFTFRVGPQGADIDFSSLATLLAGGITFDTFVSGGAPVSDGDVFDVYADEGTARNSLFNPSEVETLKLRVIFDDNISGLAVDAPVELAGLRIGKVESVSGIIDQETFNDSRVRLSALLAIQPARLGLQDEVSPEAALEFLTRRVAEGLRARLTSASLLTGGLKVELVQVDGLEPAAMTATGEAPPIIPTTESDVADAAATVEGVFNRINNLPIEEVMQSAIDFLDSAEALISSDDIRAVPQDVRALLSEIRDIVASEDIQAIPGNVNAAVARFEALMAQLEEQEFAVKLVEAVEAAGEAAGAVSSSVEGMPAVVTQIEALAAKAEALPLEKLTEELTALISTADDYLSSDEAQKLPADVSALLEEITGTFKDLREARTVENVNAAIARFDGLMADLEEQEFAKRLTEAVNAASEAANAVSTSVEGVPELIEQIEAVAAKAESLPVEKLAEELTELVNSADAILSTEAARQLPADLSAALAEINATLTELREGGAVENVNAALDSARKAADTVAGSASDLPELLERAERVLNQASATIAGYDQGEVLSRDARSALRDISKAADALASLARMLERNPSLLLRGR